jgi:hypothetical protein
MKRPARHGEPPSSVSLDALARRWSVRRRDVRRLLQRGELPFEQVRGRLRVPLDSVRLYEQTHRFDAGSSRGPEK